MIKCSIIESVLDDDYLNAFHALYISFEFHFILDYSQIIDNEKLALICFAIGCDIRADFFNHF